MFLFAQVAIYLKCRTILAGGNANNFRRIFQTNFTSQLINFEKYGLYNSVKYIFTLLENFEK